MLLMLRLPSILPMLSALTFLMLAVALVVLLSPLFAWVRLSVWVCVVVVAGVTYLAVDAVEA
eukprot:13669177-Alexandrium_andersonii.AAC.1